MSREEGPPPGYGDENIKKTVDNEQIYKPFAPLTEEEKKEKENQNIKENIYADYFYGNVVTPPSQKQINDQEEAQRKEYTVLDDLSKIMLKFPGYNKVSKLVLLPKGIYWAIIKQDNGKYTLERVKCVIRSQSRDSRYDVNDFYIVDENDVNKTGEKFSSTNFLGRYVWKKSLFAIIKGISNILPDK